MLTTMADLAATGSARKIDRPDPVDGPAVTRRSAAEWQITGYAAARAMLRCGDTVQAGLGIDHTAKMPRRIRRPVLYQDGPGHREQRRQIARFFTPKRVDQHYRALMERVSEEQIARLRAAGSMELSTLSFTLAVEVVAAVIGLTDSRPGMQERLDRFFPATPGQPGFTSMHGLTWFVRRIHQTLMFYLHDVRPAVRSRRRAIRTGAEPTDDLVTHLIGQGCNSGEILGEAITFAPAGMITTREFINAAAWHLFTDDVLRERYRAADEPERIAILTEILRLEPVIGNLRRRTTADIEVPDGDRPATIPAGVLVDISLSSANLDPAAMGDRPDAVCPARPIGDGVLPAGLAFGDGAHKCPGAHLAILETDIFLHKLFALDGLRMVGPPRVTYKDEIESYDLRGPVIAL